MNSSGSAGQRLPLFRGVILVVEADADDLGRPNRCEHRDSRARPPLTARQADSAGERIRPDARRNSAVAFHRVERVVVLPDPIDALHQLTHSI
jgi:hypothetical protein